MRAGARALLEPLQALVAQEPAEEPSTWRAYLTWAQELASVQTARKARPIAPKFTPQQRQALGHLLRDRRAAAGLNRVQLARLAKLSDATVKSIESARHAPSRAALIRLLNVAALQLRWADLPGQLAPPAARDAGPPAVERLAVQIPLNGLLAPGWDPLLLAAEGVRFFGGAGGYLEQTHAYLDIEGARGYLTWCQQSLAVAELRAALPLARAARQILTACGPVPLQVVALGPGDGHVETCLVRQLLEAQVPGLELCLLDLSAPLLARAYQHAAERLADIPQVHVRAVLANFHHLAQCAPLFAPRAAGPRRLLCMLGGTLGHLDEEPRFLQQALLCCVEGDLLLLDIATVCAPSDRPEEIKQRDPSYRAGVVPPLAAWLGRPIWRHGRDVSSVEFRWVLETRGAITGSYVLRAVAQVSTAHGVPRSFSLFRLGRYDLAALSVCLGGLGWEECAALPYAEGQALMLYRKGPEGLLERSPGRRPVPVPEHVLTP